jgi:hypothetical protein
MTAHKLVLSLGIITFFAASMPVSAAENTADQVQNTTSETTFSATEATAYSSMRPKKKRTSKKKGKHGGCEAYR